MKKTVLIVVLSALVIAVSTVGSASANQPPCTYPRQKHCVPQPPPPPPPAPQPPPPPGPPPCEGGAGKDGQPGNDDCAVTPPAPPPPPRDNPPPPSVTPPAPPPPVTAPFTPPKVYKCPKGYKKVGKRNGVVLCVKTVVQVKTHTVFKKFCPGPPPKLAG